MALLDGEADEAAKDHLAQCRYCSQRAEALDRVQKELTARLYRIDCPPPEELGEYQLGMLATEQSASVARHLTTCPHCRLELEQLKNYLSELAPAASTGPLEQVKVLVARLTGVGEAGETRAGSPAFAPAYAALRGGSEGPITMEADGVLVVLDTEPGREGSLTIQGQVAADDQERWTGARVEAHQEGAVHMTSTVDDLGAFRLEALQPGPTELHLIPESGAMVLVKIDASPD
jgi:hypothetical protein